MLKGLHQPTNKTYLSYTEEGYNFIKNNRNYFICPVCFGKLVFHDGIQVIKHFKHYNTTMDCEWEPESPQHFEMKLFCKEMFNLSDEELEVNLGFAVPDLLWKEKGLAIEVQRSKISKKKFLERTKNYTDNNYSVLWIFHEDLLDLIVEEQNIPALLKGAGDNFFGVIYIYSEKNIYPVRLKPLYRYVPSYDDYETGETYGGYITKYKKKKAIQVGKPVKLEDLYFLRTEWTRGGKPSGYKIARFNDVNLFEVEDGDNKDN